MRKTPILAGQVPVSGAPHIPTDPAFGEGGGNTMKGQSKVGVVPQIPTSPYIAEAVPCQPFPGQFPVTGQTLNNSDIIPTVDPIVIGTYGAGKTLVFPENSSPGTQFMIQSDGGGFVIAAPPNVKPGMQVEMPVIVVAPALPVLTYHEAPTEVARQTGDKCDISVVLTTPGQYRAGDSMSGKIVFVAKQQFQPRKVTFKLECVCHASWIPTIGFGDGRRDVKQSFNAYVTDLFVGESGLEEGIHEFPFDLTIPANMPPSMVGVGGSHDQTMLRYYVDWYFVVQAHHNYGRWWAADGGVMLRQAIIIKNCLPPPDLLTAYSAVHQIPLKRYCFNFGQVELQLTFGATCAFQQAPHWLSDGLVQFEGHKREHQAREEGEVCSHGAGHGLLQNCLPFVWGV